MTSPFTGGQEGGRIRFADRAFVLRIEPLRVSPLARFNPIAREGV